MLFLLVESILKGGNTADGTPHLKSLLPFSPRSLGEDCVSPGPLQMFALETLFFSLFFFFWPPRNSKDEIVRVNGRPLSTPYFFTFTIPPAMKRGTGPLFNVRFSCRREN